MDYLKEIFESSKSIGEMITMLKNKSIDVPSWGKLRALYEPKEHAIVNDNLGRKDKIRSDGQKDKAARLYLGLEKLVTKRMVEFTCAIPIKRVYSNIGDDDVKRQIQYAIEAIYKHARINAENNKRLLSYFASCEIFTVWYTVKTNQHNLYGFPCDYKLKCKTFSPMDNVALYPLFDDKDDMIAMSFEYDSIDKDTAFFETYTADTHYKWKCSDGGKWSVVNDEEEIAIEKIPGVYAWRKEPIYDGLSHIREDIEYTVSRDSDVISYNSSPILKVVGQLRGNEDKNEPRRVWQLEQGGDIGYVSWDQSASATSSHVNTMLNMFFMLSQMPDISFEKMASLGNIGYDARQTLLTDAHLKVGDESGAIIESLEREANVIKAFLKKLKVEWASVIDEVDIEHIITPYIQNDIKSDIDKWSKFCGGKAVGSQLEAIERLGISDDPKATLDRIREEEREESEAVVSRVPKLFEGE